MTDRRVLVTGSAGRAGSAIVERLSTTEWTVRTFDLVDGDDLRDAAEVDRAMRGCAAVIHAGALAHDTAGTPEEIVATNVLGTWNVLTAAEGHRVERVVAFSSGQVFGFADGEGIPSSLPVTDAHPGS